jgi:phosphatidylserine decarboxylase
MDPLSFVIWRFWYFFRDPERRVPPGKVVVSPADGIVLYVHDVAAGEMPSPVKGGVKVPLHELFGAVDLCGEGTLIGVYMTPLSVHFNRAPIAGTVLKVVPRPAREGNRSMSRVFVRLLLGLPPFADGNTYVTQNARNTIVINGAFPAAVVQIADRYVNMIDCFVKEGESVGGGQKVGMIRMGSQCDLFIPKSAGVTIICRPGDKVRAGETVLGRY